MKCIGKLGVILLMIVFVGCGKSSSNKAEIGFLIHSSSNARWQSDIEFLKERASELGANLIIKDANGDENVQLKQAHELLNQGIDVLIVVAANQNTAGGIVREAHDKGVKVISYDRMIKNCDLDYLISFEYEKVGELMVNYIADRIPGGNCIVLWGDPNDANAVFIKNGQERALKALADDKKLNVLYKNYIENWSGQTAENKVNKVLDFTNDKIDAVVSSNIPLALGAVNALGKHGYQQGEVMVSAMDATVDLVRSMLDGGITMTVTKPIEDLANGAIDLAMDIVNNKKDIELKTTVFNGRIDVPAKLFPPMVIDKNNYEKELIDKGFFTREEIFNN